MSVKPEKFKRLKAAHNKEKAEDYVEMIEELEKEAGEARLTDLAKHFGVSNVTAHKIVQRLLKAEFVTTRPYRAIFLTAKGKKLAEASRKRHAIVYQFLRKLGVAEEIAQIDAEGLEHHVSQETLEIFKKYLKR